jgi:hypothetical protein
MPNSQSTLRDRSPIPIHLKTYRAQSPSAERSSGHRASALILGPEGLLLDLLEGQVEAAVVDHPL